MIDFSKVQKILEEELGTRVYRARVIHIATLLDKLDMDREDGAEELIAKEVIDRISGKVRYIKNMDVMDAQYVGRVKSLEELNEKVNGETEIEAERIKDFINIGSVSIDHNEKRTLKSKIDQIKEIEKEVKEGKKLTEIRIGKQTANDWLSDVIGKLKVGNSKFIKDSIRRIRKKSQDNYIGNTATDLVRRVVTKNDLKNMNSREICDKYKLDYNGTTRKFISRLKLRLEVV